MSEVSENAEVAVLEVPAVEVAPVTNPTEVSSETADQLLRRLSEATPLDYDLTAKQLVEGTITLTVQLSLPGASKKVDIDLVYSGSADTHLLSVSKKILESPELDAVKKLDTEFKQTLKKRNLILPSQLKGGFFRVSKPNIPAVHKLRNEFIAKRTELVTAAIASYETRRIETMHSLDHLANEGDYMSVGKFAESFGVEIGYLSDNVPEFLESVSPELFKEAQEQFESTLRSNVDDIVLALRAQFSEYVSNLSERLTVTEDGRKPNLHASAITKVTEFLNDFKNLNIANDAELEILVDKSRQVLGGMTAEDVKDIRKDDAIRNKLAEEFGKIAQVVKSEEFATLPGRRKFGFNE